MEIKCDKKLSFVTIFDQYLTEIIADNKVLVLLNNLTNKAKEISVIDISGNLGKIRVGEDNDPHIQVETDKDTETEIVVYGLRGLAYSKDATEALRRKKKEDRLIFANDKFKVFDNHVEDSCYGRPDAYIISPEEIVSSPDSMLLKEYLKQISVSDIFSVTDLRSTYQFSMTFLSCRPISFFSTEILQESCLLTQFPPD